jgi:hypothetical protein
VRRIVVEPVSNRVGEALATMPDGTKKNITTSAQWRTDSRKTATVDDKGNVVGVNAA